MGSRILEVTAMNQTKITKPVTLLVPDLNLFPVQGFLKDARSEIPVGITRFQRGNKILDFVTVEHTGNLQDSVHRTVNAAITTHNPQIVITEGHPTYRGTDTSNPIIDRRNEIIDQTKREVENVQQNNGVQDRNIYIPEAGYAALIAREHGIPSIGGEPSGKELFDLMKARGYSSEVVVTDRFLREIEKISPDKRQSMTDREFAELLAKANELVDPLYTVSVPPLTFNQFKEWYARYPLSENRKFVNVVHKDFEPHQDGNYFQVLACSSGVVRDKHLVTLIADLHNQGYDKIMVVYGLDHLLSLRPVLEDRGMFGSSGIFMRLVGEDTSTQQAM